MMLGCADPADGDDAHEVMITCSTNGEEFASDIGNGGGRDGVNIGRTETLLKIYLGPQ